MPPSKQKEKKIKAWCGFVDNKIDIYDYETEILPIFKDRKRAKECYEDVRRCEITYKSNQ